jgi:cation diffusion facilitator family transporter
MKTELSKKAAAFLSIGFSIILALVKLTVALLSGSLSILAEAADSIIDLVTDGVTLLAVRIAARPPDENHPYGHARAENLGALAQAVLLVVLAGGVMWSGFERIFFVPGIPDISAWMFAVIAFSIGINGVRVYKLHRAACQFKSQALAASVVNFANDILRSVVVLLAMGLIVLHQRVSLPLPTWFIQRFDAFAAVIVSLIALRMAWVLGEQAIHALMDSVPDDLGRRLESRISRLPTVVPNSAQVRARFVGEQPFVEVMVGMPRGLSIEEAHELISSVEDTIRADLREAEVLVHVKPTRTSAEPYTTAVYSAAQRLGLRVHHLDIYQLKDGVRVDMDLELPCNLTLQEAHTYSENLETAIANELPCPAHIAVHLEPRYDHVHPAVRYEPVEQKVHEVLETLSYISSIVKSETFMTDEGLIVTLHCRFPAHTLLTDVHTAMARMEQELRRAMPDILRVQIDPEPVCEETAFPNPLPQKGA